jgi:[histone H3]-lysine36 N-trimethyltransferase
MAHPSKINLKTESVDDDAVESNIMVNPDLPATTDRELQMCLQTTANVKDELAISTSDSPSFLPSKIKSSRSSSSASIKSRATSASSIEKRDIKESSSAEASLSTEPTKFSKLVRAAPQKLVAGTVPLVDDLPDATMDAKRTFALMESCTYSNKFLGYTEHAMECDCPEEWGK